MDENEIRKFVREVAEETKGNIVVADFAVAVAMKAIAAEREACATVAEEFEDDMGYGKAQKIADAIRMRSNANVTGLAPAQEVTK